MANSVSNLIFIKNADDNVVAKVKEIFKTNSEDPFEQIWTAQLVNGVFDNIWPNGENDYDRDWVIENCGAKWFNGNMGYVDSDGTITINIESAWDPILGWVEKLGKVLTEIKSDVYIQNSFEDEGYNFAGVQLVAKDYSSEEYINMEDWDVDKFYERGEEYESYWQELINMMEEEVKGYFEYLENKDDE